MVNKKEVAVLKEGTTARVGKMRSARMEFEYDRGYH
jgi:hypothetical protein